MDKSEYGIENIYRRFPRAPFSSRIIIHDQYKAYFCNSVDISEKGISVAVVQNLSVHNSDEVMVTVRHFPELGTFSARAVVLREFNDQGTPMLGFYFLHINPHVKRTIAQYVVNELKKLNQEQQAI